MGVATVTTPGGDNAVASSSYTLAAIAHGTCEEPQHSLADHWIFDTTRSSDGRNDESALQESGTTILRI